MGQNLIGVVGVCERRVAGCPLGGLHIPSAYGRGTYRGKLLHQLAQGAYGPAAGMQLSILPHAQLFWVVNAQAASVLGCLLLLDGCESSPGLLAPIKVSMRTPRGLRWCTRKPSVIRPKKNTHETGKNPPGQFSWQFGGFCLFFRGFF